MHSGRRFTLKQVVFWTRRDLYFFIIISLIPTSLYYFFDIKWLVIPWVAIALIGTAAAFLVGFKNTQTYNRLWEARQIWGAIINTSRAWGILTKDMVKSDKEEIRTLYYRHIAWLTALRYQMREPRVWENMHLKSNVEFRSLYNVPEHETKIEAELEKFLNPDELAYILRKKNRATQIISLQSSHLSRLKDDGKLSEFDFIELEQTLVTLYDHQGKSERIKNFPYPRQFATINQMFVRLFIAMLPFGILQEFGKMSASIGEAFIWATVPCSVIVGWVFHVMERIGEATENPFEGGANDVPISSISRTIEIDLRDMLDEKNLPSPLTPTNDILM
ncbi:bestrophin family protein [Aurantibacillus circumpalustris]|uniref:bestrophin family protein n=1 Tax=Aurantibacillus circumpalustris TaxID=3036359 RepID=UPI00295BE61F|nr:bestrophin family ion channel [Aurantibacillus circumpalustris]